VSRVCLTGFMGAGKSTVGAIVAERLGLRFIDLDREIEAREHAQVPEIFSARGEDGFRVAESEALADVLAGPDAVVARAAAASCSETRTAPRCERPGMSCTSR
jgi:shikimate kinase